MKSLICLLIKILIQQKHTQLNNADTGEVVKNEVIENIEFDEIDGEYEVIVFIPANTLTQGNYVFAEFLYESNHDIETGQG